MGIPENTAQLFVALTTLIGIAACASDNIDGLRNQASPRMGDHASLAMVGRPLSASEQESVQRLLMNETNPTERAHFQPRVNLDVAPDPLPEGVSGMFRACDRFTSAACMRTWASLDGTEAYAGSDTFSPSNRRGFLSVLGGGIIYRGWKIPQGFALLCAQVTTDCVDDFTDSNTCDIEENSIHAGAVHTAAFANGFYEGSDSDSDTCEPDYNSGGSGAGSGSACETDTETLEIWQDSSGTWYVYDETYTVCY